MYIQSYIISSLSIFYNFLSNLLNRKFTAWNKCKIVKKDLKLKTNILNHCLSLKQVIDAR